MNVLQIRGCFITTLLIANISYAAGFSLYTEGSATAIGNFAAGIAAEAADASTAWYNPAGLALIHSQQVVFLGVGVAPKAELAGVSTFSTAGLSEFYGDYVQSYEGYNGASPVVIPALYYARPLGERATFGFSIVSPFGMSTQWSQNGVVRYAATTSKLTVVDVSPEIGGQITQHLALGGGLDFQYGRVTFNRVLGAPGLMQIFMLPEGTLDSLSENSGDSFGLGFHAGILWMGNLNHSRVGLNYQSAVTHQFNGISRLIGPLAATDFIPPLDPDEPLILNPNAVFSSENLSSNDINLPAILTLSIYQDLNENLALEGSIVYTGWHSFKSIILENVAIYDPILGLATLNAVAIENYQDAWRFAIGANYHLSEKWMLRLGGGIDKTPTGIERDVRVPDRDRLALSIGTHYLYRQNLSFDLGYTHLFLINDAQINKTDIAGINPPSTYNVNAKINGHADLIGIQATWLLDGPEK